MPPGAVSACHGSHRRKSSENGNIHFNIFHLYRRRCGGEIPYEKIDQQQEETVEVRPSSETAEKARSRHEERAPGAAE
jgi:hypothetical protein